MDIFISIQGKLGSLSQPVLCRNASPQGFLVESKIFVYQQVSKLACAGYKYSFPADRSVNNR
jgi:hypothetical protein